MLRMKFFLLFGICIAASSASPITEQCAGPLISVIGNHYAPKNNCWTERNSAMLEKLQEIRNFYISSSSRKAGITDYLPLGTITSMLTDAVSLIEHHVAKPLETAIICTGCKSGIKTIQYGLDSGLSTDQIMEMTRGFCLQFEIFSEDICTQYLDVIGPSLLYILAKSKMTPEAMCGFMLPKSCDVEIPLDLDWSIEIPERRKNPIGSMKPSYSNKDAKKVVKILHLSDTHFDKEYVEGSSDECDLPLCCRDPPTSNTSSIAGKYGGWKCDIPERTVDSLLDFVVKNISDIDHVIWTGDIPAHDLWSQSKETNLEMINRTVTKMKNYFNTENSVLPSIGNHEPVPGNLLPPPSIYEADDQWKMDWLYNTLADHWTSIWLENDTSETINKGGYYVTTYRPGLKMISINSIFCYSNNWWLLLDSKDPGGELEWLVNTLLEAESLGEKVHISAHVPPGNHECLKVWALNYYRIVERFQDTIAGQFFGHTHNDEFALIAGSDDPAKTVGMMMVGPSATTYTMLNPGFRILYVDGDYEGTTREVLDYETWIMDLEESNKLNSPVWKKMYSAKEAFGVASMKPEEWRKVYERLKTDDEFLQQYHRFYWKDSPKRPICDDACKEEYLCGIMSCIQYGPNKSKSEV